MSCFMKTLLDPNGVCRACGGDFSRPNHLRSHKQQRDYSNLPTNLNNDTSSVFAVHPVTGESLSFPFITDEMAHDDYFDTDYDSDLGDQDSDISSGAEEAYFAHSGDSTNIDTELIDDELTISRFTSFM